MSTSVINAFGLICITMNHSIHLFHSILTCDAFSLVFNFRLQYNSSTNTYSDREGVTVSVPGFGDTSTVECLTFPKSLCAIFPPLAYYNRFVDYFVYWVSLHANMYVRSTQIEFRL